MFKRRRSSRPATIIGRYLRAAAHRAPDGIREPLRRRLRKTGWHDADAVAGAAFEIVVRDAYVPGNRALDVAALVRTMHGFVDPEGVDRVPLAEGEVLVRVALGEDLPTDDIPVGARFRVHLLVFVGLALELNYSATELDAIIVRAEAIAAERGFAPTPAHPRSIVGPCRVSADNKHLVRRVTVGEMSEDIDEELAPIIEVIWRLGIGTWTCCQDSGESNASWGERLPHMKAVAEAELGWAYIDFPVDDGLAFLTALAQGGPRDAFYVRMTHWAAPDAWKVMVTTADRAASDHHQESHFTLRLLLVRFPSYDRTEILRRLTNYEAGRVIAPAPIDWSSIGR